MLAEHCKKLGADTFYSLHEKLFEAYFVGQKNIGDKAVLRAIAKEAGINDETIEAAWADGPQHQRILENYNTARKFEIKSVPSFAFGEHVLTGVVSEAVMRDAAKEVACINAT